MKTESKIKNERIEKTEYELQRTEGRAETKEET